MRTESSRTKREKKKIKNKKKEMKGGDLLLLLGVMTPSTTVRRAGVVFRVVIHVVLKMTVLRVCFAFFLVFLTVTHINHLKSTLWARRTGSV